MRLDRRVLARVASFLVSWWMGAFVISRLSRLRLEYLRASKEIRDDAYLVSLCSDPFTRASLGKNAIACDRAEVAAAEWPLLVALGRVAQATYLCGDTPCVDIARSFLSSWGAVAACVGILALSPAAIGGVLERIALARAPRGEAPAAAADADAVCLALPARAAPAPAPLPALPPPPPPPHAALKLKST